MAFSNDAADVLADALSATNTEATAHIFTAIDSFLNISDSLRRHRATRLFTGTNRSEEHTSELQSLMRISYAVFCLKKKKKYKQKTQHTTNQLCKNTNKH